MIRPKILVRTARKGAQLYRRDRDLPGAVPGLLSKPEQTILPQLIQTEGQCEEARRSRSPGYRPAHHVQVLAALLAEFGAQANASGSDALRLAI